MVKPYVFTGISPGPKRNFSRVKVTMTFMELDCGQSQYVNWKCNNLFKNVTVIKSYCLTCLF